MIYNNIYELIGRTPMIRLNNINSDIEGEILAKLEFFNPSSSIKDRAAYYIIEGAEKSGRLKPGGTIIEGTSGNTGIGLAMVGAAKGYRVILVMPESMSLERRKLIRAYGADIILTDKSLGMEGSVKKAEKLAREKGYFLANQFKNTDNSRAHYETTAVEIIEDTGGDIDAFVAGVGTSGTLSGIGKKLKEYNKNIKIYGIEPEKSQVLQGNSPGAHGLQGIGANFIPDLYNEEVVDGIISVSDKEAYNYSRRLSREEGILSGITAGANLAGARKLSKKLRKKSRIVTVLPDTGERYLSTDLFSGE